MIFCPYRTSNHTFNRFVHWLSHHEGATEDIANEMTLNVFDVYFPDFIQLIDLMYLSQFIHISCALFTLIRDLFSMLSPYFTITPFIFVIVPDCCPYQLFHSSRNKRASSRLILAANFNRNFMNIKII